MWSYWHTLQLVYKKAQHYIGLILLFPFHSYVKSQFDDDSCLPTDKMILAIWDTLCHTQCVWNYNLLHIAMVIA